MREDATAITNNFRVDADVAGPTVSTNFDAWTSLDGSVSVQIVLTRQSDATSASCDVQPIDRVDGCQYGPVDDLKYKAMCEMGGGHFTYGSQTYDCSATSWPSALFCEAPAATFLQ